MTETGAWKVAMVGVLLMVLISSSVVESAVDCRQVASRITGCLSYVKLNGPAPARTSPCCKGLQALQATATSGPIRQAICRCLETVAKSIKPNPAPVAKLPSICGIKYAFSLSQDCSKVT